MTTPTVLRPGDPAGSLARLRDLDLAGGPLPGLHLFFGHRGRPGTVGPWALSQWWNQPFTVDGVGYPNAETYMMMAKARLFGDRRAWDAIRAVGANPRAAKDWGRLVNGFEQATWDAHAYPIVVAGNLAKFSQHPDLRAYLLGTAPALLVEASPYDRVWGIGVAATDPRAGHPAQWRGTNLLGFALTEVRAELAGTPGPRR